MSFDVELRSPGGGFAVALDVLAPPSGAKIFVGSLAVTFPNVEKIFLGAALLWPSGE